MRRCVRRGVLVPARPRASRADTQAHDPVAEHGPLPRRQLIDPDDLHEQYIANLNRVLDAKPEDLVVTTHLCRGNNQSMWAAEGGYDFVAEALFGELAVNGYFLEFDDARSGTSERCASCPV